MLQDMFDWLSLLDASDYYRFGLCLAGLVAIGIGQYLASAILGFEKKFLQLYLVEFVAILAFDFLKVDYMFFMISLPVVMAFATWRAYLRFGRKVEEVVSLRTHHADGTVITRPRRLLDIHI